VSARLHSVSVGKPKEIRWRELSAFSGFEKHPVKGPVAVHFTQIEGDGQGNTEVHGGREKAVYAYPIEHYRFWESELGVRALEHGSFGENLTTEGLLESELHVGDRLRIGTSEFAVSRPRFPCFKMNIRFEREDMIPRFLESERSGFYLSVVREGVISAGDPIERTGAPGPGPTIVSMVRERKASGSG
jgi:MOSC domain-containing protein YiiM